MNFSSPIFLFLFLPVVLSFYLVAPSLRWKNAWLLIASLVFYAWGEVSFVALLAASTLLNYGLGRWIDLSQKPSTRKLTVGLAIALNIGLLGYFKYTNLLVDCGSRLGRLLGLSPFQVQHIVLPIGISFFTFHALSYVVDIYRRKCKAATHPGDVALYIFFFPQLIAGPILRWHAISPQLQSRTHSVENLADGVRRFVGGMAKKVFVANTLAVPADQIFHLTELTTATAWVGIICYTLQIYFDFSGYSDMAVGLGKMFGFTFLENFNFPYIAQSLQDFWRRWHISLSTWFRDYLYIPLGGNRVSGLRTYLNLVTVFFLCGLWHGASLSFAIWGLYHGAFLVLERTRFGRLLPVLPQTLRHLYALLVIMIGWVFFRADSLPHARYFLAAMVGLAKTTPRYMIDDYATFLSVPVLLALVIGMLFSTPLSHYFATRWKGFEMSLPRRFAGAVQWFSSAVEISALVFLLLAAGMQLAANTYNPFIYYRF